MRADVSFGRVRSTICFPHITSPGCHRRLSRSSAVELLLTIGPYDDLPFAWGMFAAHVVAKHPTAAGGVCMEVYAHESKVAREQRTQLLWKLA